ncbi:stage V sporulation protein AC [Geobacillus subterraneus]|uniref:Stage V sporulation protein AC n=2 Tax=Geobacillus TaxID=129337 RepID=A0ABM6A9T3_9BACL|nr:MULTISPECIES: SpoVA/SpoVAEb family sporulation membrane protein [Geobacillus]AMX83013.1 stage V sporulation protein AC [Geobacillus subterraneus]KZS27214.1 stage V sporulation protein AC [Geobacillus subterraneus]OXB91110.1 stage V sporulation protein AC [Geobacillus uzenensis]QIZ68248.1 SpoVA/SpoVAEb family sporulation membrane protein [Geobacillus subterraneus]WPZ17268.1 SpoVA/SpoVAEb family sporulation membrane protein [Geobacillus subterraneus]
MGLKADYLREVKAFQPSPPYAANAAKAFFAGGALCALAQWLAEWHGRLFAASPFAAQLWAVTVMAGLAIALTAVGRYDDFSQFAGAGATMLMTGLANALASAAIEHRSEGWTAGVAGQMLKAGGATIIYGVIVAYVLGLFWP